MSGWSGWLKAIQLKPRFLFGLWLLGAIILFLPDAVAESFGIRDIRQSFRGWIGIGTLAAFAFWCVQLIPFYRAKRNTKNLRERVVRSLGSLSQEEWLLLAYCSNRNQRTIPLEITHRAANALVAKGILIRASGVGDSLAWPFTIPEFLWEHLKTNPEAIFNGVDPNASQLQARFQEIEAHIRRHD